MLSNKNRFGCLRWTTLRCLGQALFVLSLFTASSACSAGGDEKVTQTSPGGVTQGPASAVGDSPSSAGNTILPQSKFSICKRGIASGEDVLPALTGADLKTMMPGISWWYNWHYQPATQALADASDALGLEYVPMVFTAPFDAAAISASIKPSAKFLLTFNEPNFDGQGNLTPAQAASYWPQIEKIADEHNLQIVSPALNFCGGGCNQTDPFAWFDAFFAACPNCRVDHLAIHAYVCYGSALTGAYLDPFIKKYNKKIWLTEFDCLDGSADASQVATQTRYMKEAVPLLENNPMVYRYAWFLARANAGTPPYGLLDASGALTQVGKLYNALEQPCAASPSN